MGSYSRLGCNFFGRGIYAGFALVVDDTGRWLLNLRHASFYQDFSTGEEAPPAWSLRLVLNLTRTFARMPNRPHGDPEKLTPESEIA